MSKWSAGAEAIVAAFRPQVAVLHGDDVAALCHRNNVDNLADMLLPFSAVGLQVSVRDPTNQSVYHTLDGFSVELRDVRSHAFVAGGEPMDTVCEEAVRAVPVGVDQLRVGTAQRVPVAPPAHETDWYDVFCDTLLRWAEPAEHEFVRHYIAAVLAVSTGADDPLERLAALSHAQNELQHGSAGESSSFSAGAHRSPSKWMLANTLKYYVLVHDALTADQDKAKALYESMRTAYGDANCCFLCINSTTGNDTQIEHLPDLWTPLLQWRCVGVEHGIRRVAAAAAGGSGTVDKMLTASVESASAYFDIGDGPENAPHGVCGDEALVNGLMANVRAEQGGDVGELQAHAAHSRTLAERDAQRAAAEPRAAQRRFRTESIPHALSNDDLPSSAGTSNGLSSLDASTMASSLPPQPVAARGACLTADDRDRLGACVADFVVKALVPFIERQMKLLNEQVISRKGLHKSFMSGARKWLAGSSPSLPPMAMSNVAGQHSSSNVNLIGLGGPGDERSASPAPPPPASATAHTTTLSYGRDSGELQIRRFADLAFVCRQYYLAYQTYQTLRRDFHADQAWLYYAGAMEMSALCAFLISQQQAGSKPYSHANMDTAIATYLNTCNRPTLALRATLLGVSMLGTLRQHSECAQSLIRLSGYDSDLVAGVMLERAARCLHAANVSRKAALHLVLAGHRYAKSGNGALALRCYAAARTQYAATRLRFAVDHVNYTIGRHALALLPTADVAVDALARLFGGRPSNLGPQTGAQHTLFLTEYMAACNKLASESGTLPQLKVPYFDMSTVSVFLGGSIQDWDALGAMESEPTDEREESVAAAEHCCAAACHSNSANGAVRSFTPTVAVCNQSSDNSRPATAPIDEPLCVCVSVHNRQSATIALCDVALCVTAADGRRVPAAEHGRTPVCDTVLQPHAVAHLYCAVVPDRSFAGQSLTITSVEYTLSVESDGVDGGDKAASVRGQCAMRVRGPRLNATKQHMLTAMYAKDLRLHPAVAQSALPLAAVSVAGDWPSLERHCLCGELVPCQLLVRNQSAGAVHLTGVAIAPLPAAACAVADAAHFVHGQHVSWRVLGSAGETLSPSRSVERTLYVKAPSVPGRHVITMVVYYESARADGSSPHRCTVRAVVLHTSGALRLSARLLQAAPHRPCVCLRVANTWSAGDGGATPVFHLRTVSFVAPNAVAEHLRLGAVQPASSHREMRLRYGEVENVCVYAAPSAPSAHGDRAVSSSHLCTSGSSGDAPAGTPHSLLPWRPNAALAGGDETLCALYWLARFDDRPPCFGETWTQLGEADTGRSGTTGEPATLQLPANYGLSECRSTVAALAADVDLLATAAAMLRCSIVAPANVAHCFATNRACTISVTLRAHWHLPPVSKWCGGDEAVADPLSALHHHLVLSVAPAQPMPNALHWCGLAKRLVTLGKPPTAPMYKCSSGVPVQLEAVVFAAGVYTLPGLELRASLRPAAGETAVRQRSGHSRAVTCDPFAVTVVDTKSL